MHFPHLFILAAVAAAMAAGPVSADIRATGFQSSVWAQSDLASGVPGFVVEDFEDATLAPGLKIGWDTPAGTVQPASALPNTFDPASDPGGAFAGGAWDGTRGLLNTRDNQAHPYTEIQHWGDVIIQFSSPVWSAGFSVQQMDYEARLVVNGTDVGGLAALCGLGLGSGRLGFVRIDAVGNDPITSILIRNGRFQFNDGFVLDHLVFAPAEPAPGFTVTGFLAVQWGSSAEELGIAGFLIEDFEDRRLVPNLLIGADTPAGNLPLAAVLPATFQPASDPGGVFGGGAWDGTRGLLNTRDNQAHPYTEPEHWGDLLIQFTSPVSSAGFSIHQMDFEARLLVNGADIGGLSARANFLHTGGRQGFVRIDAPAGQSISSITLKNGRPAAYDGFIIDHLASKPGPSAPGTVPELNISRQGAGVVLAWSLAFPDWTLVRSDSLAAGAVWTPLTPQSLNATDYLYTEQPAAAPRYFRLRKGS